MASAVMTTERPSRTSGPDAIGQQAAFGPSLCIANARRESDQGWAKSSVRYTVREASLRRQRANMKSPNADPGKGNPTQP